MGNSNKKHKKEKIKIINQINDDENLKEWEILVEEGEEKKKEQLLEKEKEKEKEKVLEKENEKLKKDNKVIKNELYEIKQKLQKYNYPEVNKLERYNSFEEEYESLLKSKLKALKSQFIEMNEKLENLENINDLQKLNTIKETMINNKSINIDSIKTYCCCCEPNTYLSFNFNCIGILFVIFNLIGVYQLINILNSTKEEMVFGIKSFLFAKNRTYYFPENDYKEKYENYVFNNIPDFNLLFLSSIIGNLFLKGFGYRISSIIYMFINSIFIFIVRTFDFPNNYNFFKLILIIIYYVLLFLSIGSIALFSQQIYFDGLTKYYSEYKEKKNYINENDSIGINNDSQDNLEQDLNIKKKGKESFFFYLCFTEIPAYFINLGINYFLKKYNIYNNIFDIFINTIIIYGVTTSLSILLYSLYSIVFIKNVDNQKEEKKSIRVYRILGYIIYCEKKEQGLIEDKENKINLSQTLFIEDNKDENKENEEDKKDVKDYLKNQKNICCYSCKLGAKKFLEKSIYSLIPIFCCYYGYECCCKCCFKCCCCYNEEEDLSELNQGNEQFCYCYKIQREISWFCDLLFKNEVIDFIILDILNDLLTIGFQKKMKKILMDNENNHNLIIFLFIIYFFILSFLNKIYGRFLCNNFIEDDSEDSGDENEYINKDIEKKQDKKIKIKEQKSKEYSKQKLGLGIILLTITNFFLTTIFSGFSIFGSNGLQNFTFYLIPLPLGLTKFYIFLLMNCVINIMDNGNIDLLSNSTIISLFLMLYNLISSFFTDIFDIGEKTLIIFQFSFGLLFIMLISIYVICLCSRKL